MRIRNAMTIRERRQSSTSSMVMVPVMVMKLCIIMAKLLLRASLMVSTSLVKRLISSPWVWASK